METSRRHLFFVVPTRATRCVVESRSQWSNAAGSHVIPEPAVPSSRARSPCALYLSALLSRRDAKRSRPADRFQFKDSISTDPYVIELKDYRAEDAAGEKRPGFENRELNRSALPHRPRRWRQNFSRNGDARSCLSNRPTTASPALIES